MNTIKRLLSSWRVLLLGAVAVALFILSPRLIYLFDPTAGTFSGGILQWLFLAIVAFFGGVFCVWVCWQAAFPSADRESQGNLGDWFLDLPPWGRWVAVQVTFLVLGLYWVLILFAVPT